MSATLPAFPVPDLGEAHFGDRAAYSGMTLRDYFAAKAMQGMLADLPQTCYGLDWAAKTAAGAFEIADAMLKAREVKP